LHCRPNRGTGVAGRKGQVVQDVEFVMHAATRPDTAHPVSEVAELHLVARDELDSELPRESDWLQFPAHKKKVEVWRLIRVAAS